MMASELFSAIEEQCSIEALQKILAKVENINMKNKFGETALHVVTRFWDGVDSKDLESYILKAVKLLIDAGVDVDSQDHDGFTALQYAVIQNQNKEVVACLIDAGSDTNLKNEDGQTALHLAADNYYPNQVDFIRFLLQQDGVDVDSQDGFGWTALHRVVQKENKEVVECLIDAGADINMNTPNGETPLHLAAETVNVDIIQYLITRGADVNAKDGKKSKTPLHNLMNPTNRRFEGDKLLLAQVDALEVLLSADADINAVEISKGNTPLHYFILSQFDNNNASIDLKTTESFFKILKIFIKYRADFKLKNLYGQTPMDIFLQYFLRYENSNYPIIVLDTFIKYGIMDVESLFTPRLPYGETILHDSCSLLNYKIIKFMVNHETNIEVEDKCMETPLLALIRKLIDTDGTSDNCKILDYFLSLNPDVNVISDEGYHILNLDDIWIKDYPEFLWKTLIKYIAKKQSTDGYLLHEGIAQIIYEDIKYGYQSYLDKCTEELKSLQELKFPWMNLYDILMDRKKKLDCYVKNKVFTREFNELLLAQKYPIYGPSIVKKFSNALQKQEVMEKAAVILSSYLPCQLDPSHLVIKKIISHIKVKYLRYLCEPESEEFKKKIETDELKISFDKYVCSCYEIE